MLPTLPEAFRRAILKGRNLAPNGEALTLERITQILGNGEVEVLGVRIPVSGEGLRTLRPGQKVAVAWERGRPVVAIAHSAKRSGAPTPLPRPTAPLVEELFLAARPDGKVDVHFRNFDDVTALRLDRFVPTAGFSTLRWGPLNDRFFVQEGAKYHVFKFDRTADEPFDSGTDPSAIIRLERTEDLSTKTMTLATLTVPTTVVLTPQTPGVTLISVSLDVDGALIGSFEVGTGASYVFSNVPGANFSTSILDWPISDQGTTRPVVADLTKGIVLLSAVDNPAMFEPLWSLVDTNTEPRITDSTHFDGSVITGLPRPTTWVQANTVTFVIDPPFEGHTQILATWWAGFSEVPTTVRMKLDPIFVLGKAVPAALRVRGFVAWMELEYLTFVGQTFDVANWHSYLFPFADLDRKIVMPSAPFPVTAQSGAIARAPLTGVTVPLYEFTRPALGLSFAPTLNRVVWRKPTLVAFFPADGGLNAGGADSPGFVTLMKDGATVQISPALRASLGQRGLVPVMTDFLYQLDNPAVALPAKADVNFFVDAWAFGGPATLKTAAADFPPEAAELAAAKPLAEIPKGVIQPTPAGLFSLYVNNDPTALDALGLFEELPA